MDVLQLLLRFSEAHEREGVWAQPAQQKDCNGSPFTQWHPKGKDIMCAHNNNITQRRWRSQK